jgi:phage/plasmid-like protein (TIGR03299 family)
MSANINITNGRASMFYVKETPWHKLGVKLEELATAAEAIEAAQLDYTVVKKPIYALTGTPQYTLVPRTFATVRTDTNIPLGVVGSRYHVIQNRDAFKFFDSLVGEGAAIYETAGALGDGERIWILAKLPGHIKVSKNDIIDKYLLLTNSHDGSSIVRAKLTPIRVVCANTLSMALRGSEQEVRIRHTSNADEMLEKAHELLGLTNELFVKVQDIYQRMSLVNFSGEQVLDYVKTLVPDNEEAEHHTRTEKVRNEILRLHESGEGSELSRGTLWGAYNAVTEYTDHVYTTSNENTNKKLTSMWFGASANLKNKAFDLALEKMGVKLNRENELVTL